MLGGVTPWSLLHRFTCHALGAEHRGLHLVEWGHSKETHRPLWTDGWCQGGTLLCEGGLGQVSSKGLSEEQHVSCHLKGASREETGTDASGQSSLQDTEGGQTELRLWEEEKSRKKGCGVGARVRKRQERLTGT